MQSIIRINYLLIISPNFSSKISIQIRYKGTAITQPLTNTNLILASLVGLPSHPNSECKPIDWANPYLSSKTWLARKMSSWRETNSAVASTSFGPFSSSSGQNSFSQMTHFSTPFSPQPHLPLLHSPRLRLSGAWRQTRSSTDCGRRCSSSCAGPWGRMRWQSSGFSEEC